MLIGRSPSSPRRRRRAIFLKKAAGVAKGSSTTGKGTVGKVTTAQLREIAETKMADLNANDIDGAVQMLRGSAVSMGLEVVE